MTTSRFFTLYYSLGTLAFAALDWILAAPIRAAFLHAPNQRVLYYAALVGLGFVCRAKPTWAPVVGMAESSLNLLLVLLSIMLPIYALADQVEGGGAVGLPFTRITLLNVAVTGSVLIYTFHRSQRAFQRQTGRKP